MNRFSHNEYGDDDDDEVEDTRITQPYTPSVRISTGANTDPYHGNQGNNSQIQMNMPILSRPIRPHTGIVNVEQIEEEKQSEYSIEMTSEYEDDIINYEEFEEMLNNEGYTDDEKSIIFSVVTLLPQTATYKHLISILCNDSGLHKTILCNSNLIRELNQRIYGVFKGGFKEESKEEIKGEFELPIEFMLCLLTACEEDGRTRIEKSEFCCQVDFDEK